MSFSDTDDPSKKKLDPRDPDYSREGVFVYHNCYRCDHGRKACVRGHTSPRNCPNLYARND